jgi:ribose 5-phosphate isomerase A
MTDDPIKKALGYAAAERIEDGTSIGIGSGTTIYYFIQALSERVRAGLQIRGCPTSQVTLRLAVQAKIPLLALNRLEGELDVTVDGADLIDESKRMIKGRGGALLREKIVATAAKKTLIIIDEKKKVNELGNCLLPLEVLPMADHWIMRLLEKRGFVCHIRQKNNGTPYLTDNQNHIIDLEFKDSIRQPEELERELKKIPGILETGLFFGLADTILLGKEGGVEVWS